MIVAVGCFCFVLFVIIVIVLFVVCFSFVCFDFSFYFLLVVIVLWSEPSGRISTWLAPPYGAHSEVVQLLPLSESSVQLEWLPFCPCDPGLHLVEYRVVAQSVAVASFSGKAGAGAGGGGSAPPTGAVPTCQGLGVEQVLVHQRSCFMFEKQGVLSMFCDVFMFWNMAVVVVALRSRWWPCSYLMVTGGAKQL
ncbi:unnamed protein product [Polarella glacialis]|uniref:Uncharacterized protein n=1 Tax=Polarella glacialis TaxID=89957 RepID=A0A813LAZ9_POLGL|nr:unnamed protein product [Polarella glacialis]